MTEKQKNTKNENTKNENTNDICNLIDNKITFFDDVIQKTILHVQKNKILDILGIGEVSSCIERLGELSKKIKDISVEKYSTDVVINTLQIINNELSGLLKVYGTDSLDDFLLICFGNNSKIITDDIELSKFELLKKYFHPTSYTVVSKNYDNKQKKGDDNICEMYNLSCLDVTALYKQFHMKVYGIKLYVRNSTLDKGLYIFGTVDDIILDFLNNKYINHINNHINTNLLSSGFKKEPFDKFISSFMLKDYLLYETVNDVYSKYAGFMSQNTILLKKHVSSLVREFISDDMYNKRNTLINLLIYSSNYENQYLAYLLYDILSNEVNGSVDTQEQIILFDSLPWAIKQHFKQAMKKTIQYTNELSNFDINKIPLEQQICLMKTSDSVKEKAMMKLKEVKAKSEDSGSKARHYLDALLKIPFDIFKREPILDKMGKIKTQFKNIVANYDINKNFPNIPKKDTYTSIEVQRFTKIIKGDDTCMSKDEELDKLSVQMIIGDKKQLISSANNLHSVLRKYKQKCMKISSLTKDGIISYIQDTLQSYKTDSTELVKNIVHDIFVEMNKDSVISIQKNIEIKNDLQNIDKNMNEITNYMAEVKNTLDKAVHGHDKAKKQIERIIGQWLNGKQDGYCFGFEGPPGVGKTSLAKRGLSDCLKDDNGESRPFTMIQMGGDSNGSTLHGHNYTYVGSTWGSIVQILIDKKCMNPIIFIDEVDKISKTEHGREIVGILTHLLDPAQNDCFQDKYFSGIDLDLSKALFILSYNDVEAIDKILLDRVHRIKFNSLTLEDKLIISKTHILPEVFAKMGLEDTIEFDDDVLKFMIEEYTLESGVRKLKEIIFEVVGEINLEILKNVCNETILPIKVTIADIKQKYFKDKREVTIRKVPNESIVGYANGMYATSLGNGGTLPIHAKFFPSENFLELKLTGLQQEVMRESMHISLTVAWNLTTEEKKKEIRQLYDGKNNKYGINIHPGDGSVQKDGPSAGGIITIVLYSLLNNIPIKPQMAMTGEIQMSGDITAIGGLNHKILGSIKAGVKEFIYPKENKKDFDEFYEKYQKEDILNGIKFYEVNHISEAIELILDKPLE
jgi:ATP-dependent Lon protease